MSMDSRKKAISVSVSLNPSRLLNVDTASKLDGANVVPERMIMQLLAPADGSPKISIQANGVTYAYNYDPSNTYKTHNFANLETATDKC